jgi:hypothetical protein
VESSALPVEHVIRPEASVRTPLFVLRVHSGWRSRNCVVMPLPIAPRSCRRAPGPPGRGRKRSPFAKERGIVVRPSPADSSCYPRLMGSAPGR